MKKFYLLMSLLFLAVTAFGQDSIPNGNFEHWTSSTYNNPEYYQYSSNYQNYTKYSLPFNVTQTTDAYHGRYAVQIVTNASATDTAYGYFLTINPNSQNSPSSWTGGMPYDQMPTGIRGYYKYNVATADSGTIIIAFSKAGTNIGTYMFTIGGIQNTYTLFNFTLKPALTETPDSVVFAVASSKIVNGKPNGIAGDTLKIDSVSFTGVSSQPTMMNGDFELWQSTTINLLNKWHINSNGSPETGVSQSTDAVKGKYAVELMTYSGTNNGHTAAVPGQISTGYYPNNCNGNCSELGGYPFTNQTDTLAFYYKYTPVENDSAAIYLSFKKNGVLVGGTGINLTASANYKYAEIPFSLGQTPDSLMATIQSSSWPDSSLSFVGSDLIIDRLYFKSETITKTTPVITWNNPSDIVSGTALSSTQLNATANVAGTFVYTPPAGTILSAGNSQTLSVAFTPVDTVDFDNVSASVTINVAGANAVPFANENSLMIFPNPASGNFTIESPDNISQIVITNADGKIVWEETEVNLSKTTVSLSGMGPGVYFVSISTMSTSAVKKLIVK